VPPNWPRKLFVATPSRLAAELRDYRLQRGYAVKTAVEQQVRADREAYWVVRTDLVAGLPPGWRGEDFIPRPGGEYPAPGRRT
jgi:hypothetical protein